MPEVTPRTSLEKAAGSLPVSASLTALSAAVGTPLAALLPVLATTLAAERQRKRVDGILAEINDAISKHQAQLAALTDQQYKLMNEAVLALLHTTSEHKMEMLRNAVHNGLRAVALEEHDTVFLSRVIRDISAEEAQFLMANFSYERIWLSELDAAKRDRPTLAVKPNTPSGRNVLGLFNLGLVTAAEPTFDDMGLFKFSPFAAKVIALLEKPSDLSA
jgi:hypothetical protein